MGGGYTTASLSRSKISTLCIYFPDNNKWLIMAAPCSYVYFAMIVLMDKLLIIGGSDGEKLTDKVTNRVFMLDDGEWKLYTRMPTAASAVSYLATAL